MMMDYNKGGCPPNMSPTGWEGGGQGEGSKRQDCIVWFCCHFCVWYLNKLMDRANQ